MLNGRCCFKYVIQGDKSNEYVVILCIAITLDNLWKVFNIFFLWWINVCKFGWSGCNGMWDRFSCNLSSKYRQLHCYASEIFWVNCGNVGYILCKKTETAPRKKTMLIVVWSKWEQRMVPGHPTKRIHNCKRVKWYRPSIQKFFNS